MAKDFETAMTLYVSGAVRAASRHNTNKWLKELNEIAKKNDPVILICRTGRRTGIISKFLSEKVGYRLIYDVTDGITDWIKKGNTVVNP